MWFAFVLTMVYVSRSYSLCCLFVCLMCDSHVDFDRLKLSLLGFLCDCLETKLEIFFRFIFSHCESYDDVFASPQACSLNLFNAETGRRLLDTTLIFTLDPNGGKPEKVCLNFFG